MEVLRKNNSYKKWIILGVGVCVMIFMVSLVWGIWTFVLAERHADCDGGLSVWRRNPAAFSSYVYEIRDGVIPIETGLRSKQLKDFLRENNCLVLGGG